MSTYPNPLTLPLSDRFTIKVWKRESDHAGEYIVLHESGEDGLDHPTMIKPDEIVTVIGGLQMVADYCHILNNSAPLPVVGGDQTDILQHPVLIDLAPQSEREMLMYTKAFLEAMKAMIMTAKIFDLEMVENIHAKTLATLAKRVYGGSDGK